MRDKLDVLLKTDDKSTVSLEQSKKYINTKRKINGICKALSKETTDYVPLKTVENIELYLENKDKMERILKCFELVYLIEFVWLLLLE